MVTFKDFVLYVDAAGDFQAIPLPDDQKNPDSRIQLQNAVKWMASEHQVESADICIIMEAVGPEEVVSCGYEGGWMPERRAIKRNAPAPAQAGLT